MIKFTFYLDEKIYMIKMFLTEYKFIFTELKYILISWNKMCNENQVISETPSNQAFEGVTFITIVNSNFLSSRMSYSRRYCWWSIKHVRRSFGQQFFWLRIYTVVYQATLSPKEIIHMFVAQSDLGSTFAGLSPANLL